jgi:hypothetical protein
MTMTPFEAGRAARLEGLAEIDNPFVCGTTKLGNPRFLDGGADWLLGFNHVGRIASAEEMAAARKVDVARFRRRSNRFYR